MKKQHAFMMRHLRSIMKIGLQAKVTNIKVTKRAGLPSMEDLLTIFVACDRPGMKTVNYCKCILLLYYSPLNSYICVYWIFGITSILYLIVKPFCVYVVHSFFYIGYWTLNIYDYRYK